MTLATIALTGRLCAADAAPSDWRLEFLADLNIPTGTPYSEVGRTPAAGTNLEDVRDVGARKASGDFGGISAIAFDEASGTLYALSDSSTPVVFRFRLAFVEGRLHLEPTQTLRLREADGTPLPVWSLDPEGLALSPHGTMFVASEGYVSRKPPVPPAILEFDLEGRLKRRLAIPEKYLPATADAARRGVRTNKGFESLTLSPDGARLYTAIEAPLEQDAGGCGPGEPCVVRVLEIALDVDPPRSVREFAYSLDVPGRPSGLREPAGAIGVSEMLALETGGLLAIERGFFNDLGSSASHRHVRISQVALEGATDILGSTTGSLDAAAKPVRTSPVLDLKDIVGQMNPAYRSLDNFEGICFGPRLGDGSRSVLLVSDNNFQGQQRTAFLLFRLTRGG